MRKMLSLAEFPSLFLGLNPESVNNELASFTLKTLGRPRLKRSLSHRLEMALIFSSLDSHLGFLNRALVNIQI
jgi:hypothetical protein